jgi:membrane protein YdbS with pleckstrin-like domain
MTNIPRCSAITRFCSSCSPSRSSERLAVGPHDVLLERGFLAKQRVQVSRDSIRAVRVSQGVMQRLFKVGNIEIFTGGDYPEIAIRGLPRPDMVRALLAATGGEMRTA